MPNVRSVSWNGRLWKLRQPAEKGAPVTMNEMAARLGLMGANVEVVG